MLFGRWEDVNDAAAHGELTTPFNQLRTDVGGLGQPSHQRFEGDLISHRDRDLFQFAKTAHEWLQDGADRSDDHPDSALFRMAKAAENAQPFAYGVAARAQALVRKRLPGWKERNLTGRYEGAERSNQVDGFAPSCRCQKERSLGGQHPGQEWVDGWRRGDLITGGHTDHRQGLRQARLSGQQRKEFDQVRRGWLVHFTFLGSTKAPNS
ncbi:hypothetical protein GALL_438350 [mine drainage metagenome]|uniref:Uncharacterized protein n=1 Tax=mine drainage metagenome TaxID=410659 RepID=A0A1J5PUI3_9ZZZZ